MPRTSTYLVAGLVAAALLTEAAAQARAQASLDASLRMTQYVHDAWTVEDGLPQNSAITLEQSADGYLWIGTQAGLARFDGERFTVFDRTDGLRNNEVRALAADGDVLWIGTHGGGLSRLERGDITTYTTEDGLPSDLVRSLHVARDGTLWIGTIEGGLSSFDGATFTNYSTKQGLAGDVVLAIHEAPDGDLWIGTQAGLSIFDGSSFTNFGPDRLPGSLVWAVEPAGRDGKNGYWIGLSGGLARVVDGRVVESYAAADGLCGEIVGALHLDEAGTLWIGTLGGGICRLSKGRFATLDEASGLTNDRVRSLLEDHEGSLWIGTESGGLNRIRQGRFIHTTTAEGLSSDMAMTVTEGPDGTLWVGTKDGGLDRIRGGNVRTYSSAQGLPSDYVSAVHAGRGGLWVGMYGGGACLLVDGRFRCIGREDGLLSDNVFSILQDRRGVVWVGTDAGLSLLENGPGGARVRPFGRSERLTREPISVIHEDASGTIWVGSYGLTRITPSSVTQLDASTGFTDAIVSVIHEDGAGTLWVGTYGGGLCRIVRQEASRETGETAGDDAGCITSDQGLPNDQLMQVVTDDAGGLWIGSQAGLSVLRLDEVAAVFEGRKERLEPRRLTRADGLKATEVNGGTQPSSWRTSDGRLLFATNHGVAVIDPAETRANTPPPPVHVESVDVNGVPLAADAALRLEPGNRDLTFHYTGISFAAPEEVRFRFILEGYDGDWVDAGNRRDAYYTNLPPGQYTFRVAAANGDGVWNETGDRLTLYLEPYFYQTWWFAVLCVLAAFGVTWLGFRLRIRQLRARERELEQQVSERTRDLRLEKERTEEAKVVIEGQAEKLRDLNHDLEAQAEQLRDLNENLQAKVQEQFELLVKERERYEADLIDAKERAEASDRLKTAILNNLSHEFRTPLTAILGFTEIIAMEAPEDLQEFTGEIDRGGKRLLRTLDALLEFSRLEADESGMRPDHVDLTTTAFSVVRDLKKTADAKNLPIHFKAAAPVRAYLDAAALEEIVWNLVDNAIKFTSEGQVEVSTGLEGERVFVRVSDTGVGIGADFRERMYEAFAQESDGFDRAFEGVGLGLTITQRLVEHMDGEIAVDTEVGRGSTFTVYFSAHPAREAAASTAA